MHDDFVFVQIFAHPGVRMSVQNKSIRHLAKVYSVNKSERVSIELRDIVQKASYELFSFNNNSGQTRTRWVIIVYYAWAYTAVDNAGLGVGMAFRKIIV